MSADDLLNTVSVSSPCTADWESMIGNDNVRFCRHCHLSVHNLSTLTPNQALRLIKLSHGRLCIRYILLPDGTIKTSRPPFIHRIERRVSRIAAGAFSATLTVSSAAAATAPFDRSLAATRRESSIKNSREEGRLDQTLSIAGVEGEVGIQSEVEVTMQGSAVLQMPREPLVRAAHSDDIDALKQLLVGKPNPNVRDKHSHTTALEHAIFNANREILQLLLTAGADVNLRDSLGQTPIMMLGEKITPEIVWDLIRAGAKVNLRDQEGNTALIEAGACNNLEVLKELLEAGAKVDARNNDGETALMRAASEGLVNNVRALILAGADVNARDGEGRTAWMRALENEHRPVLRLLRSYGVDESMQPTKAAAQP